MFRKSSLIAVLFLVLSSVAHADFNDGVFAYANGDYEKAWQTMMPMAQNSKHPYAQYYLGVMFAKGQGVEQDEKEASQWYLKAAKQGVKEAQFRLAQMYSKGKGVPQDHEAAYAWYKVATHLSHKKSKLALEPAREKLTDEQFAAAQQLADDYIDKYGEAPELGKKSQATKQ